jgi:nitrogen fixation NifU-like protein
MTDLRELYQELILDHNRNPRNFRKIEQPQCHANGFNPLCGDRIAVYLELEDDRIRDIAFEGAGCAICTASASLMTQALKGKNRKEAEELFHRFHEMLTAADPHPDAEALGKLAVFAGVREFPIRVKCATLPWHTFHAALKSEGETVSTE